MEERQRRVKIYAEHKLRKYDALPRELRDIAKEYSGGEYEDVAPLGCPVKMAAEAALRRQQRQESKLNGL